MALAYLLGKGSATALHTKVNIPLLLVLSILPDIDIFYGLLTGTDIHRGPVHSIIFLSLLFIPVFIWLRKKAIPYYLALISHPLIADFITGGQLQLLWPLTTQEFGLHELGGPYIDIASPLNIALELTLFAAATFVLIKTGDWKVFFTDNKTNLILIIPIATVLLPSIVGYPFNAPLLFTHPIIAAAHLFYLVIFAIAVVKASLSLLRDWIGIPHKPAPNGS
jgi:hypothetical protein